MIFSNLPYCIQCQSDMHSQPCCHVCSLECFLILYQASWPMRQGILTCWQLDMLAFTCALYESVHVMGMPFRFAEPSIQPILGRCHVSCSAYDAQHCCRQRDIGARPPGSPLSCWSPLKQECRSQTICDLVDLAEKCPKLSLLPSCRLYASPHSRVRGCHDCCIIWQ